MRIDFVSDVVCPWCVIGLKALEQALARTADVVAPEIHFQPFELNPGMPPEGQNVTEHVKQKYGADAERSKGTRELIRSSAEALGFPIRTGPESRIWNTFDAHRLLHWAGLEGRQTELKMALFTAYFTEGRNPGDVDVLVDAAGTAGLDPDAARAVFVTGAYADDVRRDAARWRNEGISAVPTVIINGKYAITGGQPVETFEKVIRHIAAETAAAA
jgi:predicted DsbA family dithiol-disulfide isomerase